jgi:NAD(P)-dependent dehydrogenase (short-subunit alcohol dehydrogenase family)
MRPSPESDTFSDDPLDLRGRVALVTGAARGIGAASARLLAAHGATLALCDRNPGGMVTEADGIGTGSEGAVPPGTMKPPVVLSRRFDVRDPEASSRFVEDAVTAFGRVDILVNNAGGTFASGFAGVSPKGEASLIAENFTQVTHLTRAVLPHMGPGGSIVNVTSIEAHRAAPGFAVYAAMKAGLENLTCSLALELAPRSIRVNSVAPDAVPSGGEQEAGEQFAGSGIPYRAASRPPLGRYGTPDDAAGAVLYLCSELARFVTGVTIPVDGGNRAAGGWHRSDV